jgi:hypothetical protein
MVFIGPFAVFADESGFRPLRSRLLKALVFIPFAFIAGDQGFALFAPYAALMFMLLLLTRWRASKSTFSPN